GAGAVAGSTAGGAGAAVSRRPGRERDSRPFGPDAAGHRDAAGPRPGGAAPGLPGGGCMISDPLDALRLPGVPIEPRPAFADALWRRIAGSEEAAAQSATVRYFVGDLDEAIAFYRDRLGFEEELHPSPTFAML